MILIKGESVEFLSMIYLVSISKTSCFSSHICGNSGEHSAAGKDDLSLEPKVSFVVLDTLHDKNFQKLEVLQNHVNISVQKLLCFPARGIVILVCLKMIYGKCDNHQIGVFVSLRVTSVCGESNLFLFQFVFNSFQRIIVLYG